MRQRAIEVRQDVVIKTDHDAARLHYEAMRCQAGASIADELGLVVPAVLARTSTSLTFPRIRFMDTLECHLSDHPEEVIALLTRAGQALADLHGGLRLPANAEPLPDLPLSRNPLVCLHGDFVPANLGLADGRLVVFDWAPPDWLGADAMLHGPCEWDLAMFLFSLYLRRPFDPRPIAHLDHAASAFLSGYRNRRTVELGALPRFYSWVALRGLRNERGWPRRFSRAGRVGHAYLRIRQACAG